MKRHLPIFQRKLVSDTLHSHLLFLHKKFLLEIVQDGLLPNL